MNNIIKPNNYTPIINSDTVIQSNQSNVQKYKEKYLKVEKYLSEFKTELLKRAARTNLDVYSKGEVNSKVKDLRDDLGYREDSPNQEGNAFERINYLIEKILELIGDSDTSISQQIKKAIDELKGGVSSEYDTLKKIEDIIKAHLLNFNNPHRVTKEQVGLGNVTNDAQVKRSEMGKPQGVAVLDEYGKIPSNQLPSYVDDVIDCYATFEKTEEGLLTNIQLYESDDHSVLIIGETGKIYADVETSYLFRWTGTLWSVVGAPTVIGTATGTAFDGKRGKDLETKTNDHISNTNNPHNVTVLQIGAIPTGGLKTINGLSLEGSGNIEISGGSDLNIIDSEDIIKVVLEDSIQFKLADIPNDLPVIHIRPIIKTVAILPENHVYVTYLDKYSKIDKVIDYNDVPESHRCISGIEVNLADNKIYGWSRTGGGSDWGYYTNWTDDIWTVSDYILNDLPIEGKTYITDAGCYMFTGGAFVPLDETDTPKHEIECIDQSMFTEKAHYIIDFDADLQYSTIQIPEGSVLTLNAKLSNGRLYSKYCVYTVNDKSLKFDNVRLTGVFDGHTYDTNYSNLSDDDLLSSMTHFSFCEFNVKRELTIKESVNHSMYRQNYLLDRRTTYNLHIIGNGVVFNIDDTYRYYAGMINFITYSIPTALQNALLVIDNVLIICNEDSGITPDVTGASGIFSCSGGLGKGVFNVLFINCIVQVNLSIIKLTYCSLGLRMLMLNSTFVCRNYFIYEGVCLDNDAIDETNRSIIVATNCHFESGRYWNFSNVHSNPKLLFINCTGQLGYENANRPAEVSYYYCNINRFQYLDNAKKCNLTFKNCDLYVNTKASVLSYANSVSIYNCIIHTNQVAKFICNRFVMFNTKMTATTESYEGLLITVTDASNIDVQLCDGLHINYIYSTGEISANTMYTNTYQLFKLNNTLYDFTLLDMYRAMMLPSINRGIVDSHKQYNISYNGSIYNVDYAFRNLNFKVHTVNNMSGLLPINAGDTLECLIVTPVFDTPIVSFEASRSYTVFDTETSKAFAEEVANALLTNKPNYITEIIPNKLTADNGKLYIDIKGPLLPAIDNWTDRSTTSLSKRMHLLIRKPDSDWQVSKYTAYDGLPNIATRILAGRKPFYPTSGDTALRDSIMFFDHWNYSTDEVYKSIDYGFRFFNTDVNEWLTRLTDGWYDELGNLADTPKSGLFINRPTTGIVPGFKYYCTDTDGYIIYQGNNEWRNEDGTLVNKVTIL